MRVTEGTGEAGAASAVGPGRSPAARARRAQIVDAAIETLAEIGHGQTTFARIRERADISSTRLISYHFGTKGELMSAVLEEAALRAHQAISHRVAGETTATGALRARIEAQVEWVAGNRSSMRAMYEICLNERDADGTLRYGMAPSAQANVEALEPILRAGQESGEFRRFDTGLMALTLKSAIDAAIVRMTHPPCLTVAQCVDELTTLAHLATRRES
ncbi:MULTISPECIES: TetR family transcriptional regulator [unclassified Streptomyces]|uniref:TetR/AcrR family transcriptional regulator n=1 Tax=unclassified Streptomyces TaxID=2593676 RepID=UPI00037814DE|nr:MULTISPECIES: TetR family transcriptional regulator [unclassified Streptomyces]MYT29148.1 TetR family transcriptional regulator [Streptomyces sp. SID8354]